MTAGAAPSVDGARLWRRHVAMAALGATLKGGVNRLALTPTDIAAHRLLADWALARGFTLQLDPIGNLFVRREGSDPAAAPAVSGSHSDTQPTGGRFDGIFGVLAAFEALEALEDAGTVTRRPIEAVVWNNEEGSRFVPGTMGSGVYAGVYPLESALRARDEAGVGMAEAVAALRAALPEAAPRAPGAPMAAFVEAHIEQGPVLEAAGDTIGVVTGIQGARKFAVEVLGAEAHAGTTARAHRKDAFVAAVAIVNALHAAFHDAGDTVRFTVGQFAVWPNARAVVPGRVRFAIDFRHPDRAVLDALGDRVAPIAAAHAGPCRATVTELPRFDPVAFEGAVPDAIARAARARGYRWRALPSGALHDAGHIAAIRPTGMVFVPCAQGISHNEAESADPADLTAGAQVVADVLVDLANRP